MSTRKSTHKIAFIFFLLMGCSEESHKTPVESENQAMEYHFQDIDKEWADFLLFPSDSTWLSSNNEVWQQKLPDTEFADVVTGFVLANYLISFSFPFKKRLQVEYRPEINEDGFTYFEWTAKGQDSSKVYRSVILQGSGLLLVFEPTIRHSTSVSIGLFPRDRELGFDISEPQKVEAPRRLEGPRIDYLYLDDGIKKITASSELKENTNRGTRVYSATRLKNRIASELEMGEGVVNFRNYILCWAEGVPGPGIGEYLDISFSRPSDKLIVLNGYVDLIQRELYKQNNRLRTVKIISENPAFEIEYTFEDIVKFHEITLPATTENVRMTIESVYPGSLYDDTCVSAVMLPQQRLRPEAEERRAIMELLRQRGYFAD